MQACNLQNLPEKLHDEILYAQGLVTLLLVRPQSSLDLYHILTWPSLSYVAEDSEGRVVGYILAKMYAPQRLVTKLANAVVGRRNWEKTMTPTGM